MTSKRDRFPLWFFLVATTCIYWGFAIQLCTDRALWFDELFTYYVASSDSLQTLLAALQKGMDNQPPFDAILRHFSMQLLGQGELAFRFPSMLCIYVTFLLLVWLGIRTHSDLAGMLAGTLLFLGEGYTYLMEGRPYPVIIALTALCCVFWRLLVDREYKPLYLWGLLGLSLGCALVSHYYTVALVAAVGFASIAACLRQRRILPGIGVMAIVLGGFVLAVLPYAAAAKSAMGNSFWSPAPSLPAVARVALSQFSTYGFWLVTILGIASVLFPRAPGQSKIRLNSTEAVLWGTIMLAPLIHYLVAHLYTNAYVARYSIFALVSGSLVAAIFLARQLPESLQLRFALAACCISLIFFQLRFAKATITKVSFVQELVAGMSTAGDQDLIIPSVKDYLQLFHYADAQTKKRLVFLYNDPAEILKFKTTTLSLSLRLLSRHLPLTVKDYQPYIQNHKQLVVIKPRDRDFIWLDDQLRADGFTLIQSPGQNNQVMYLARQISIQP